MILFCLLLLLSGVTTLTVAEDPEPDFTETIANDTVTIGENARMNCRVKNLGTHKVAWVRVDTQTILTIYKNVIIRNTRITLDHDEKFKWDLLLSDVNELDRGWYMCQINTDPMKYQMAYLEVVVPPDIKDKDVVTDIVVREGTNISLNCKAKGFPVPDILWQRDDNQTFKLKNKELMQIRGQKINITKVSRLHMGIYTCIASNGVQTSVSKKFKLKVQFPPMLSIQDQLEGAYIGQDVTLACSTEAYPESINYWTNETGAMIIPGQGNTYSGNKFLATSVTDSYKVNMTLKIFNVMPADFQSYKCVARNSLGETEGLIRLYEVKRPMEYKFESAVEESTDVPEIQVNNHNSKLKKTFPDGGSIDGEAFSQTSSTADNASHYAILYLCSLPSIFIIISFKHMYTIPLYRQS